MKVPNGVSIAAIVFFLIGVFLLFGAEWFGSFQTGATWIGGIIVGLCVIVALIGFFGQGKRS